MSVSISWPVYSTALESIVSISLSVYGRDIADMLKLPSLLVDGEKERVSVWLPNDVARRLLVMATGLNILRPASSVRDT